MKVVQINLSCLWGSTGKICDSVSRIMTDRGIENYIFYTYGDNPEKRDNYIRYGNELYRKFQSLKSRIFGNFGFNSYIATTKLINNLDRIKPDIVHIHNIHGHDCNFETLFNYLKEKDIKVFYTFHDCWTFTGYCPHFTMAKCDNWLHGCGNCILRRRYSWFLDKSRRNCARKQEALQGLDLTVITPSQWLADLTKKSFLKEYPVKVINNGIDLSIFKPLESGFRAKHNITEKRIVLGVAFGWGHAKGLDVFIQMSKELPESYKVVLVGTNSKLDKLLPENIISIHRTHDLHELAEIYSAADVFINPTREENYPTVNMEAIACGTPVITFDTGGSSEMLDELCGVVVLCDDYESLKAEVLRVCEMKPFSKEYCVSKSKSFDMNDCFKEYVDVYEDYISE